MLDEKILYQKYISEKKSMVTISKELKCAPNTVWDYLCKYNIPIRKSKKFQIPKDVLYTEYIENEKTIKQIAEIFGASYDTIRALLNRYDIEARVGKPKIKSIFTKEFLLEHYINKEKSIKTISKEFGFCERYVGNKLKEYNINRKRRHKKDLSIDLTGKKFGILIVKCRNMTESAANSWVCLCKCGKEVNIPARRLLRIRGVRSCGCARAKNCDWLIIPPYFYNQLKTKAKKRNIYFELTRLELEELYLKQNKKCALSGVSLNFARANEQSQGTASLDRIDSNKPYILSNVQWVHKTLNFMKWALPNDEFINWCYKVNEYQKGIK